MEDLTSILSEKCLDINATEYVKQGRAFQLNNGQEQKVTAFSTPSINLSLTYNNLSLQAYLDLKSVYEANHSNTFIYRPDGAWINEEGLGLPSTEGIIDLRSKLMTENASVYMFTNFSFTTDARTKLFSGTIEVVTSLFFNFAAYQAIYSESSSYNPVTTTNTDFIDFLELCGPYQIDLGYTNNNLTTKIGNSAHFGLDKGGLRKIWVYKFLINENKYLELLKFYRKHAGIMGEFGVMDIGYDNINNTNVQTTKARFRQDSFNHRKRIDGLYEAAFEIVEVL